MLKAVILAGGRGERFWPMSRINMPKQCLNILDGKSMVKITIGRLAPLFSKNDIYISTGSHLASFIKQEMPDVKYVIEPCPKNTAACIGLSAAAIAKDYPDAIMFIETTDHVYKDTSLYQKHIKAAAEMAKNNKIVLIGIKPTHPHTGFGYIHQGSLIKNIDGISIYDIEEFKEKPQLEAAKQFLESGDYLWNSGMFIAKVSVMLDTIKSLMPQLYAALIRISDSDFGENTLAEEFSKLESISIDYGIMEKADNIVVVRGEMWWYDIGDWDAMELVHKKDSNGNIIKAEFKGTAKNCIIFGDKNKPIRAENIENIIIVDTSDSLLVCRKGSSQKAKEAVKQLEQKNHLLFRDYSKKPEKLWISINSEDCSVEGDYTIATIDVNDLDIKKNEKEAIIKVIA